VPAPKIPRPTPAQIANADQQMARADATVRDLVASAAAQQEGGMQGLDLFTETALHCAAAAAALRSPRDRGATGAALGLLARAVLLVVEERQAAAQGHLRDRRPGPIQPTGDVPGG
jgi:hypothetical protein